MTGPQCLVFGSTGLVGSSIASALGGSARTASVRWSSYEKSKQDIRYALETLRAQEPSRWAVIWAAGRAVIASPTAQLEGELRSFGAALTGTAAMNTDGGGLLVLISSAGAIYRSNGGAPASESTPVNPTSAYGEMKLVQEEMLRRAGEQTGLRGLILRVASVYGPRQDVTKPQGLISALVRSAVTGAVVQVFVPRETRRHYVYSEDVGRIVTHATQRLAVEPGDCAIRLAFGERSRTISEVAAAVGRVCGARPKIQFMTANPADHYARDVSLTSEFDDASARVNPTSLEVGINRLLVHALQTRPQPAEGSLL